MSHLPVPGRQIDPGHAGLAPADRLPTKLRCCCHALAFDGVTENGLGCCAACGCSGAGVHLELAPKLLLGQRRLRQHAEHRLLDDPVGVLGEQIARCGEALMTHVAGVRGSRPYWSTFRPVSLTLDALMTTTKSPPSIWGV